jgi:hypothetical protein
LQALAREGAAAKLHAPAPEGAAAKEQAPAPEGGHRCSDAARSS